MNGSKALALETFCKQAGYAYMRFDYSGHGESEGVFEELTLQDWLEDTLHMFDMIKQDKVILIGSSMGGWLSLHCALQRQQQVQACIGIASAPDFTSRLMTAEFSATQRQQLKNTGMVTIESEYGDYNLSRAFLESGQPLSLLDAPIKLTCPVYLLHGQQDVDVPYAFSINIAEKLLSHHVSIHLVKDGDHRLSREQDLKLLMHLCQLSTESNIL